MTNNAIIKALSEGRVVAFKSQQPRYYCEIEGKYYFKDSLKLAYWKLSNARKDAFYKEDDWEIIN